MFSLNICLCFIDKLFTHSYHIRNTVITTSDTINRQQLCAGSGLVRVRFVSWSRY